MKFSGWIVAIAAAALAAPAAALQGSDVNGFIDAIKSRDNNAAMDLLRARGSTIVNARNASGETPLLVAIVERDSTWTQYLLQKGADPNLPARSGEVPLVAAARLGFADAVDWLLSSGANVDKANRMGETALIVAVQQRHAPIVRVLLEEGADPDKTDAAAGYSARDYAKRDTRSRDILELIEATKRTTPAAKTMDEFKLD